MTTRYYRAGGFPTTGDRTSFVTAANAIDGVPDVEVQEDGTVHGETETPKQGEMLSEVAQRLEGWIAFDREPE